MNDWKDSCKAATTGQNISLLGGAPNVLDGIHLGVGSRVLVKDQSTNIPGTFSPQNGIYVVRTLGTGSNGTWVRSNDANTSCLMQCGATVYIDNGTVNAKRIYQLTSPGYLYLDVTGLRFELLVTQAQAPSHPMAWGSAAIGLGDDAVTITGLALGYSPSQVLVTVSKITDGLNLFATVRSDSISPDGFIADLSAATDASTYMLYYFLIK